LKKNTHFFRPKNVACWVLDWGGTEKKGRCHKGGKKKLCGRKKKGAWSVSRGIVADDKWGRR